MARNGYRDFGFVKPFAPATYAPINGLRAPMDYPRNNVNRAPAVLLRQPPTAVSRPPVRRLKETLAPRRTSQERPPQCAEKPDRGDRGCYPPCRIEADDRVQSNRSKSTVNESGRNAMSPAGHLRAKHPPRPGRQTHRSAPPRANRFGDGFWIVSNRANCSVVGPGLLPTGCRCVLRLRCVRWSPACRRSPPGSAWN